jgi:hypothetical protein
VRLYIHCGGVRISVTPDLCVEERGRLKLAKLEFSKTEPMLEMVRIQLQLMLQAADAAGMGLSGSSILLLDVHRGQIHRGARRGSRRGRDIEAACDTIAAVWDRL